jgi:AcrR family transcriptional regulator
MKKTASERSAKRSYHHGDLRRALLDAAWRLVKKQGLEALTLREVARKVGVTHAAPYHHFPSRESLLDALTEEAFSALDRKMVAASQQAADPAELLLALGRCYIDTARAHPEHVQVMFRRSETKRDAEPEGPGHRVFGHLVSAVSECQAAGLAPAGDPLDLALEAWVMVHGFSKLWVEGPLEATPHYAERFESLRDGLLASLGESWRARVALACRAR